MPTVYEHEREQPWFMMFDKKDDDTTERFYGKEKENIKHLSKKHRKGW
jgi:hypothetical protein